ncbi:MAG: alpha/beta fold hydrolase [Bacteroidota bacterium]
MSTHPITLRDQSQNTLSLFPVENSKGLTILVLPAMGVRASYYKHFAAQMASLGYNAITVDQRGHGHSSIRPKHGVNFGYEEMIQDTKEVVEEIERLFPNTQLMIAGHSLGGQVASLFAARYPGKIKALALIAACSVYHEGWSGGQAVQLKVISRVFYPLSQLFGYFPGKVVGFGGKEARGVMRDWCHNAKSGLYEPAGSDFNYEQALASTQIPIFAASMEGDWLAPYKAVANLYAKFHPESPITHLSVTKENSHIENLDHFTWAKYPQFMANALNSWIEDHLA